MNLGVLILIGTFSSMLFGESCMCALSFLQFLDFNKNNLSVFGSVAILNAKAWIYWYLLINAVFDFLDLEKHPADEKYIWTLSHWLTFSLRRVLVEYAISFIVPYTQFIPIVNWILNLIPIGLSYVNAFVL